MKVEVAVLGSPSLIILMVCGRKATLNSNKSVVRAQELCESRGGRPGSPSLISLIISADVKQH